MSEEIAAPATAFLDRRCTAPRTPTFGQRLRQAGTARAAEPARHDRPCDHRVLHHGGNLRALDRSIRRRRICPACRTSPCRARICSGRSASATTSSAAWSWRPHLAPVAIISVIGGGTVGLILGIISGYLGGAIDSVDPANGGCGDRLSGAAAAAHHHPVARPVVPDDRLRADRSR